jgi:hypothetical protein
MAKRGAPRGNQNARKHGFYSRALDEADRLELEELTQVVGLDDEIALLRWKLRQLTENEPGRLDLHLDAANTLARLVKTRYLITQEQKKSLKDAIAKVLTDIALPLGIGVGAGVLRR